MFQASVLASGSKGNCTLIRTETTKILVDAGLSGKKIWDALEKIGAEKNKISALIISHDHSDHVKGAGIVCRKLQIPLYISRLTYESCLHKLGKLPAGVINFQVGKSLQIGDIIIDTIPSKHDTIDSSNFVFTSPNYPQRKLTLATDLGESSRYLLLKMQDSTSIILESNHDEQMLLTGPYPPPLKQRVKGKQGHLSNNQAVELLGKVLHDKLENIVLAHLSEENNRPELANETMLQFLLTKSCRAKLIVADQKEPTLLFDI
ncbi:MAG: MBL fold metallo-hydrolase [Candidatus Cloacimonadales bacterium]